MSISQDSLKRYNERTRFLSPVSACLLESDKTYRRKLLTEAQLKAICFICSAGNFTLCETCSTTTSKLVAAAARCGAREEDFRALVRIPCPDKYPRFAYFEVNPGAAKDFAMLPGEVSSDYLIRVLRCLNGGIALFPLRYLGAVAGEQDPFTAIRKFLIERETQIRLLAETFDTVLQQHCGDFDKLLLWYADCRRIPNSASFKFNVTNKLAQLLEAGHTKEI